MEGVVNLRDLVSMAESVEFLDKLLQEHGESEEQLMILLIKVASTKAILERALGCDPIVVTLGEDEE
ncbi:hypothetical protein PJKIFABJ_00146 [Pseudomonas phage PE09]|uniref:Uncharacterized protein n=1 Tax=Pseudomonas phage PE09 TaxID=2696355 RepID=A0A9E6GX52_9CAUD|nr:hypothetical protein QGX22_gp108 [Pseudomonas phage PE09]QHZ60082.1 hypothetical protein PJKIFABJ_00146 [Pseudomonas phage PE09]